MLLDLLKLPGGQLAGFGQDPVIHIHLADVVHQTADGQILQIGAVQGHAAAEDHAIERHVDGMLEGVIVVALE